MREAEGRSLFHPIHDRANFSASIEYLCQNAKRRRSTSESLSLASTSGYTSKQTNASKHERTRRTRTHDENRRNKEFHKQRAEAHYVRYPYDVPGVIGIAYNPFLNEDIRDCFFDYEQTVLLRFWTSRIATIRSAANQQTTLGLVLEKKVTATSVPKSDKRVEFGLGFSDELLRTSLMVVWDLLKPSWCPSPNADSILRATQDVQRESNSDCNLRDLNTIYNLTTTASKSNGEDKLELSG